MSTRRKSILIYVGGIATGILLTFAFAFFFTWSNANSVSSTDNIVMFEKPQQEIKAKSFSVMQVLPDGSALATVEDSQKYGMVVMFPADKNATYYDEQKIEVPYEKCVMQVGTYKYMTRKEIVKTVPVVKILNK
ncbi:MAG: hypothetical protein PHY71_02160 [Bacteroidaceae bacterium]|nr:hypothetical protein [Bacteroidaceae bacterium]